MLANDKLDQLTKKLDQMATAMISMAETINGLSLRSTEKRKNAKKREAERKAKKSRETTARFTSDIHQAAHRMDIRRATREHSGLRLDTQRLR